MQLLSSLLTGKQAIITNVNLEFDKKIKLLGLGIGTNTLVSILRNRGGDMVLAIGNARVSVGRTLSSLIKVDEVNN